MLGVVSALAILAAGVTNQGCGSYTVTAYAQDDFPGTTADGTPTRGNVGVIAAASTNVPLGTQVWVEGLGSYRVADRGHLGARHIDVLMQTHAEAMNFGRQTRQVCW